MDNENEDSHERIIYTNIDSDTLRILEVVLNCMNQLADAQIQEQDRQDLITIADELGLRFGIQAIELEETPDLDDNGDVIYKPKGGLFNDDDDTVSDSIN